MSPTDLDTLRRKLGHRYHLERELGRGGMGTVYLARELELDRLVALKVLPSDVAADPALRDRFLRESRTAASFSHPNIVPVYAVEEQEDVLAFAMGYVEGESLAERVTKTGPLPVRDAVRLMHDVAYALAYAHGRGTVHRDIKPDNIMLDRATNRALVMDFGVARRRDDASAAAGLTRVGEVVGTPEYMSPEQATGDVVDGRSDLYSLGLVMWFALTGKTAMGGDTAPRVLMRQLTEALPPIRSVRSDVPPALAEAVDRCVAKAPAERFADAGALATVLDDAELASPEIPLPIRLIARELMMLSFALPFGVLLAIVIFARMSTSGIGSFDALAPVVIIIAVLLARLGQTLGDAHRLARRGFPFAILVKGLQNVADEAASARAAGRLDPELRSDRRRTLRMAGLMLLIAVASLAGALSLREPVAPGLYRSGVFGVSLFFNAVASFGVALVLAFRDPRRVPLSERLFRAFWLRAPGRWLLHRATRTASDKGEAGPGPTLSSAVRTTVVGAKATTDEHRLDALESRLRSLEQWKRERDYR